MNNETKYGQPVRPEDVEPWAWYEVMWTIPGTWEYVWSLTDCYLASPTFGPQRQDIAHAIRTCRQPGEPWPEGVTEIPEIGCESQPKAGASGISGWGPNTTASDAKPDPLDPETWPTVEQTFPEADLTTAWPSAEGVVAWTTEGAWHYGLLSEVDEAQPTDRVLILKP